MLVAPSRFAASTATVPEKIVQRPGVSAFGRTFIGGTHMPCWIISRHSLIWRSAPVGLKSRQLISTTKGLPFDKIRSLIQFQSQPPILPTRRTAARRTVGEERRRVSRIREGGRSRHLRLAPRSDSGLHRATGAPCDRTGRTRGLTRNDPAERPGGSTPATRMKRRRRRGWSKHRRPHAVARACRFERRQFGGFARNGE